MKYLIIGLFILSCYGCGTFMARETSQPQIFKQFGTYPAVSLDRELLSMGRSETVLIAIFDLPFSLVFDTLLFPYDYYKDNINICNNHKNEDDIKKEIIAHYLDHKYNDLVILQMHQKYDYILVEYKFDCCSDIFVDLVYRIRSSEYNRLITYRHSDDVDNVKLAKTQFNRYITPENSFENMIDCYKSAPGTLESSALDTRHK